MTDESGKDAKILAVPVDKLTTRYQHIKKPEDMGQDLLNSIEHFFTHYKDLEKGKWVKVEGWEGIDSARQEILASVERYQHKEKVALRKYVRKACHPGGVLCRRIPCLDPPPGEGAQRAEGGV